MSFRVWRFSALLLALTLNAPACFAGNKENIDCNNAMSTVEMNYCAGEDFEKADAELNALYAKAIAAIPGMATEKPYDAKSWEEALRGSQRAWVAFRDAECGGHVPMFWGGGTGTTVDVLGCKTSLTQARSKELKDRYETR